jgi:DNA-binding NtrC family response regulator
LRGAGEIDVRRDPLGDHDGQTERILGGAVASEWSLHRLEEEYIVAILERTGGHRGRAAAILGIDRRTLYRKLKHLRSPGRRAGSTGPT